MCLHILVGTVLCLGNRVSRGADWHGQAAGKRVIRWWAQRFCRIVGLRVHAYGQAGTMPAMLAVNHISWLDIVGLLSLQPALFVSKASVRQWPVIGSLASLAGTIFLHRRGLSVLPQAVDSISSHLKQDRFVAVFPEGTTTNGERVGVFHAALFQAAVDARREVYPVALRYIRDGRRDMLAPFIGEQGFLPHLLRIMAVPETRLELTFCSPIDACTMDRRSLAACARNSIRQSLGELGREEVRSVPSNHASPSYATKQPAFNDIFSS